MAYQEKTISEIVENVDKKQIYLPAIQRKYVWGENQITRLMDSILKGYPFGTFLFWKVKKKTVNENNYLMYEFIKDYHERDKYKNEPAGHPFDISSTNEDETILSALDGQQRLTSLYIALKGSISWKLPKKHWNNDDAFPKKELYFYLHSEKASEDDDITYKFEFLTQEEVSKKNEPILWFKVKEIVQFPDLKVINRYIVSQGWIEDELATDNLTLLFQQLKKNKLINYFEVESNSIDDVLDIFVRVNSGGTVLSKTDLLFSTIVSYWDAGRDEIDSLLSTINRIGDHYSFTNDFIMRTCLFLMDLPITLKVQSFGKENVEKIKNDWPEIKNAVKDTVNLLNELGFYCENIIADNAVIPLIYYRYKSDLKAFMNDIDPVTHCVILDEKMELRKYMVIAQIRHIFGQSTNAALSAIRTELNNHTEKFKLSHLQGLTFAGERSLKFTADDIENWLDTYEKNAYTFMILSLLYPSLKYSQKGFHQDHMHPYSDFEKASDLQALELPNSNGPMDAVKIEAWRHLRNTLANLQLLEGRDNESKNNKSLVDWLNISENKNNVKYLPPNIDYSLANFEEFIDERRTLMLDELKRILL